MSYAFALPIVILLSGGYFLFRLRAFFILHPIKTLRRALSGSSLSDSVISLLLALSGTLGVGNIVGVTIGLSLGGAGSVFWLMVSAVFSAPLKYCEVALSFDSGEGMGMIGAIKRHLGKYPAIVYSALAALLALSMGASLQSEAIRECAEGVGNINTLFLILPIAFIAPIVCIFGKKGIRKAVSFIIPFASLFYTVLCLFVIIPNIDKLPSVVSFVISSALSPKAAAGGIGGAIAASGIKEGFARGLLSNEAGAGTSSFSHTSGESEDHFRAGVFGIFEVVFDTLILCPLTAFTILLGFPEGKLPSSATQLGTLLDSYTHGIGAFGLYLCVTAFALATVLCWYYYGRLSFSFLFGKKSGLIFFLLFFAAFWVGLIISSPLTVAMTDAFLFFMTLITVATLIKGSDRIACLSKPFKL